MVLQSRRNRCGEAQIDRITRFLSPHEADILTLGFARRFATYKRATLLFSDPARLERLLNDPQRPVLLIFAGKAHPSDLPGQQLIQVIHDFSRRQLASTHLAVAHAGHAAFRCACGGVSRGVMPSSPARLIREREHLLQSDASPRVRRGTLPVRLVASARYLPGTSGEARLLAGFAEALRRMIAESGRKDSTIEFTLPW